MPDPLATTFSVLAASGNGHAVEVLVAALDVPEEGIQRRAVAALLTRGQARGIVELIRRFRRFPPELRAVVVERPSQLTAAIRQSLLHGDRECRATALDLALECEDFEQLITMIALLQDRDCPILEDVAHAVQTLVDRLHDQCAQARHHADSPHRHSKAIQLLRAQLLNQFDQATEAYQKLHLPETVVRGILILGDPDHYAVKRLLAHSVPECRAMAQHLLMHDTHPGVLRLLTDSLARNYPHAKMMETLTRRVDLEFVCHLLRWMPDRLSVFQQKNLKQVESLSWLEGDVTILESIPPGLHTALVAFLGATGLPPARKLEVQEWLVRHGTSEGREAAASVLGQLDSEAVQEILLEGLESQSEDVQAWATSQLRQQHVPHAVAMLVERLDSPMAAVRLAAQGELQDFNIRRMLELFEHLDPELCRRAGALIRKIDPLCIQELDYELSHPIQRRRIRAARAARALGMHVDLAPALLSMLTDRDPLVRRSGIEALADVPSMTTLEALLARRNDESPRVREAALRALDVWRRQFQRTLDVADERFELPVAGLLV